MKKSLFVTLAVLGSIILSTSVQSCYYDNEADIYGTATSGTCDTTTAKYATFVQPLMNAQCATSGCHNAASAAAGANLGTYTATKAYITNSKAFFLGSIKHTSGYSQMPKGGSTMAACDIKKLETWINAGMLNN
jgi:hypothetical protein